MSESTTAVKSNVSPYSFHHAFESAPDIEFNPKWANGTGYYDHAVKGPDAPKLEIGEIRRCISAAPNNRKILLVGTFLGNVVVFQRYTDREDIIVSNMPDAIEVVTGCRGKLDEDKLFLLVGGLNIGMRVNQLLREVGVVKEED
jgi:hypothetical protein